MENLEQWFETRETLLGAMKNSPEFKANVQLVAQLLINTAKKGNKILVFGNGGSAAESIHFAGELVDKFEKERRALPVMDLVSNASVITAQSNDIGFDTIFSRQVEAHCNEGDVVIGLTTSDAFKGSSHSANIIKGFEMAKKKGGRRVGFFSRKTHNLLKFVDLAVRVPAENTGIIQEVHLALIHYFCKCIEQEIGK